MPFKIDFWCDFDGFWEGKWRQVDIKIGAKIDLGAERKNQLNISPLMPNWVRRVQVGSKKRSKIDQNLKSKMDCLLASIFGGFWWVLGGKLGWKIEPRANKNLLKNTSKKWWKKCVLEDPGGVRRWAGHGGAGILGPLTYKFSKKTLHHRPQCTRTLSHALRAPARWRIYIYIYIYKYIYSFFKKCLFFPTILQLSKHNFS